MKILWPLAGLTSKPERLARRGKGEAFRSGQAAASLDEKNIEAQAVMESSEQLELQRLPAGAYPYARTLIDNLTPEKLSRSSWTTSTTTSSVPTTSSR